MTIDPTTAKDYDDAISLTKDKKGRYKLGVHIADVAYYAKPRSALDIEAAKRGNSTYFPGKCVPMLPEALSNELCSLKEGVERLTASVIMDFDEEGNLTHYEIFRAVIKSQKRFTYEQAREILDDLETSPHAPLLKEMKELALLLNKKRKARGSVDLSIPEYVVQIDDKGEPSGVKKIEYDITHQMIEEFMLKANEIVATHLAEKGKILLFRIHEQPAEENLTDFFAFARYLGFELSEKPTSEDLQALFAEAKKTSFGEELATAFIRSMRLAYYSTENVGHFGLALQSYCHFTSPIRRYADLIIQRILFNENTPEDLNQVALAVSATERVSFKAEHSVILLKKLRLLKKWHEEKKPFKAHVSRIKPFGLSFEVDTLMLEGFLHISELGNDYFIYEADSQTLRGRSTRKRYKVGDEIQPQLLDVNLTLLETKWRL